MFFRLSSVLKKLSILRSPFRQVERLLFHRSCDSKSLQIPKQFRNDRPLLHKILKSDQGDRDKKKSITSWDICAGNTKIRLLIVMGCFALSFLMLAYKLINVAGNDYIKLRRQQAKNNIRKEIVDRNGNLLAVNLPSSSLFVNPVKAVNPEQSIEKLSTTLPNIDKKKLFSEIQSGKRFVWVKRDLSPKEQTDVFNLGLPGFDFENEQRRIYVYGNILSHVIGYVGRDLIGLAGLEKSFDGFLTNSDPSVSIEDKNQPLALSIDIRLQAILNEEIEKTITKFNAKGAIGIIVDPNNGEVLAMVNKPDFDPHHPNKAKPEELFNTGSLGIYEFGSVFKTLTMALGFDTGVITMHDLYDTTYMRVGKFQIKDLHPRRGWHTVSEIFLNSSNIGTSQIMLEVGKPNLKKYLKDLGLLDKLQIELPERGTPLFPNYSRWSDISLITMSYGYGLSISPLHFVQAMMPVVNGGKLYPLTLIKRPANFQPEYKTVFKKSTSDKMKKLLRLAVQVGTGKSADVPGYLVGGKTGTAEKVQGKKYSKNSRRSSFLGVLPVSDPKYLVYVTFDEPKGIKESFGFAGGGWVAAPTVGRVLERMVALYGLEAVDLQDPNVQDLINIDYKPENEV